MVTKRCSKRFLRCSSCLSKKGHEKHEDLLKAIPAAVRHLESVARSMYNKKSIKGQSKKA